MTIGVIYKFQKNNKINGTLFYCFEYFAYLNKYKNTNFYIIGINQNDLNSIITIFKDKYKNINAILNRIKSIKITALYALNLKKSLILDIKTFYSTKEFLTNEIYCFSDEAHGKFRFNNNRVVKYYGSYQYQDFDENCYLKLNFDIFKDIYEDGSDVFVSSPDPKLIKRNLTSYKERFKGKNIILKKQLSGNGDLFQKISTLLYVHTGLDTNNRIIPEAYFYQKEVLIEENTDIVDSTTLRNEDIKNNGLNRYTLSENDKMIIEMLS
jgi:hypothetical protein